MEDFILLYTLKERETDGIITRVSVLYYP